MENPNEQSQSYIINLLARYGSLNSIYNEVFEKEKLTVSQQQKIYNFYNDFKNVELFETRLLYLSQLDDQTKNLYILNQLKSRIQSSISLYNENLLFINKVNVYEVCYYYVEDLYKNRIKLISDRVWEYGKKRRDLNREIEPPFWEPLSKEKEAGIRIEIKRLEALETKAQGELDVIYNEWKTEQDMVLKYQKNEFNDIRELGLRFISIIDTHHSIVECDMNNSCQETFYFDMGLVSSIHKACNNKQFKNISETDLFQILNLVPTNARLEEKKREKCRMYILIHKLSERLNEQCKVEWCTKILKHLGFDKGIYDRKKHLPTEILTDDVLYEYSQVINEIFK